MFFNFLPMSAIHSKIFEPWILIESIICQNFSFSITPGVSFSRFLTSLPPALPPGSGLRLKLWVISWRCHRIWNLGPRCRHQRTECHLFGNSGWREHAHLSVDCCGRFRYLRNPKMCQNVVVYALTRSCARTPTRTHALLHLHTFWANGILCIW